MLYLILSLIVLGVVAALMGWHSSKHGETAPVVVTDSCATCNGENDKCEQECKMEAALKPVEYFDDEELDAFAGRPADGYTEAETDQFAYVMETMQDADLRPWMRSLGLRGIELPEALRDELIFRLGDA